MARLNAEIADKFNRLADLLEIEGANPFRVRAYRNAARTVGSMSRSMADLIAEGRDLSELPDIGDDLAEKIETIVRTGRLPLLEEVEQRTPAALSDLMKIGGLGPKRVQTLHRELGIASAEDLRRAADQGRIRGLEGFGPKLEQTILSRLAGTPGSKGKRHRLIDAEAVAEPLVAYLRETKGLKDIVVAGSYRRRRETVGDLDILVTARKGTPVMDRLAAYDQVSEVISQGTTRSTVILRSGMQVDLRVVPQVAYGAALHYFTGSKAHNIAVRKLAVDRGLKLNEYGVFRGDKRVGGRSEKEVFGSVDLPYIEPELRENNGEFEAGAKGRLPRLITLDRIRGDLHCHTTATDGRDTLEDIVEAARERGYEYVSINDHSRRVAVAHGLDTKRLLAQIRAIDRLNERLDDIVVLKSVEVDILDDGALDLPDDVLKELDFTVCAVHYRFNLSRRKQTERILRAMDNPHFNILAHPSGRLIGRREPYEVDMERIMKRAAECGCFLELNAQPDRLDMDDSACKMARDMGVKVAISTDAHRTGDLDLMRFGIGQARRGWLEPDDVINTRPLKELKRLLKRH
ncbi:DNA polymerase III [Thioalkalivibrio denitrificans]|uniref:DNA polymerase beta n=1 Tax=Thioalkalivibrio denitrificans TaxID=108003 RepID=A0A1V3NSX1_9GAMM|nr:DNA polymerase/3'-5' exonuclease PolX [Thioalkalivibrio denitrificans]OOG28104.1 DNA polymerase III [Thioalkalivibrio denitrificans]